MFDFFDRANYPGRRGYFLDDQGDSGSGGGGGTGSDNPDDTSGGTGGGTGGGDQKPDQGSDKTFTQDEVNALIARETAKAQRGKLDPSELGFQSGKELKDFLDAAKKQADEAKSDAERQLEEAKKNAASEAEQKVLSKANARLVAAEFKVAAKDAGVVALDDALVLAQKMDIWQQVELEGDDEVVVKGFDQAFFEELKKAKPYLFASATDGGRGDIGAGAGGSGKPPDKNSPDDLRKRYPALPR